MSTTRLIATALLVGSLQPALVPGQACADPCVDNAIGRLQRFGGKVDPYTNPVGEPSWSQPAGPLSSSQSKTVAFFNTNLTDLDLILVTEALVQIGNVKRLNLSNTKLKGETLGCLAGMASLQELDLSSTPISGHGLRQLALLGQLSSVSLDNTCLDKDSFICFQFKFKNSLKTLHFSGATVLDACLQPLGAAGILELIRKFSALEYLDLSRTLAVPGSTEAADGVSNLKPLGDLVQLTALNLSSNNLIDQAIPPLAQLTKLTELNLAGNNFLTNQGLAVLWHPKKEGPPDPLDDGLKRLDLSGTQLTDAGLAALAARNRQLVDLNISGTYTLINPRYPIDLGYLANLSKLNISNTGIDDELFRAIWMGGKLNQLASLDISGTMVTDRGLTTDPPHPAVGFMGLRTLYSADTKVTTGGVNRRNALRASLLPPGAARVAAAPAPGHPAPSRPQPRGDAVLKDMRMRP
jgi:Leucine-rich repeat (LRR) protein